MHCTVTRPRRRCPLLLSAARCWGTPAPALLRSSPVQPGVLPASMQIDYNNGANSGLAPTIQALIEFKKDYPCITHADLFTLAGAVSAEAAGGPPIAW